MPAPRRTTRTGKIDFTKAHYTVSEVADFLSFTEKTIRNWAERNPPLIDFIDVNGNKRIPVKEVIRLSGRSTEIMSK